MATTNLNLNTLAGTEKLKSFPTPYNDNMGAIDDAFGSGFGVGNNSSVDDELNGLGKGMAIIANGNTHVAITSGQFVYVRQHGSLSEGLYKATSNISANGTLSGSNLTSVSSGGLNNVYSELNSNLGSPSSASAVTGADAFSKINSLNSKVDAQKTIFVQLYNQNIAGTTTAASETTFNLSSYIPSGYSLWSVEAQIQEGASFYNLPWWNDTFTQSTRIQKITNTSVVIRNQANWSANTSVTFTLHCRKT